MNSSIGEWAEREHVGHLPEMEAWLTEVASAAQVEGGGGRRKSRVKDMVVK